MRETSIAIVIPSEMRYVFFLFSVWSFITLCRPQDYFSILALLRPSLTFGLITIIAYFLHGAHLNSIFKSSQFKLYLLLIIIMILGVPFSYYRSASLREVFGYMSIGLVFFFLFYQIANTKERLKQLLFIYSFGASIYAIYVLLFGSLAENRIAFGTMFDPNDIAFFVINFLAFNLLFITKEYSFTRRALVLLNVLIGLVVLFKTGSRGGFVACLAVVAYLLFNRTNTIKISFFKKAILVFTILLALWTISMNTERYKTILDVQSDYNLTDETGRVAIWKIGIRLMMSNPLTGVGVGRFYEGVGQDRLERGLPSARWQAAHNSFVQIGAETGVIGLFIFILMSFKVFSITGRIMNRSKSDDLVKVSEMVRAGFIGHLVCAIFLSQAYSVYWVFYIALSAKLNQMVEEEMA